MSLLHAIILGIIQGLTEFLPVSSSAHLALIPWLLGWNDQGLSFDIALHVGTVLAVIVYFFRDWVQVIAEGFGMSIEHWVRPGAFAATRSCCGCWCSGRFPPASPAAGQGPGRERLAQ